MRRSERWWPALLAGTFWSLPVATQAQTATATAIQQYLTEQFHGCSLYAYQENFRGPLPGADRPVAIASYTIKSCGGGNNYARTVGVFYAVNGKVQQFKAATPIDGPDVDDPSGVTVQGDRITVRSSAYAPDDPRCCPSLKRTASYRLMNGAIVLAR
jgi:hypothetical protein